MKKMRKFASLLMAMIMVLALSANVFAASNDDSGVIEITETRKGQIYDAYQIMVLESYNTDGSEKFAYKASAEWAAWLATQTDYVTIDAQGYITWKADDSEEAAKAFAAAAIEEVEAKRGTAEAYTIAKSGESTADKQVVTLSGLNLGYYLVDSSMGALCALTTTANKAIIREKNYDITLDKKVNNGKTVVGEPPAGYNYVEEITARIGTVVDFAVKIDLYPGMQDFVYHDSMTEGLTYIDTDAYPTQVFTTPMSNNEDLNVAFDGAYTVETTGLCNDTTHGGCEFEIVFSQDYLDTITKHETITVRYFAELNENAVTYHEDEKGNINYAKLTYGTNSETEWDPAKVFTYAFELVKTDDLKSVIDGAEFVLYDGDKNDVNAKLIPLVSEGTKSFEQTDLEGNPILDGENKPVTVDLAVYRPATSEEIAEEGFVSAKIKVGRAVIKGLNLGKTYYLEETAAPEGYKLLDQRIPALLSMHGEQVLVNSAEHMALIEEGVYQAGGIAVVNHSGIQLPETGGMGTTIFYVLGSIFTVGALILFITKRRMIIEN